MKIFLYCVCIITLISCMCINAQAATPETIWKSDNPTTSISVSENSEYLALLTNEDSKYKLKLLKLKKWKVLSEAVITVSKKISCISFLANDKICYIQDNNELIIYNINNSYSSKVADAEKFILSPIKDKILFQHNDSIYMRAANDNAASMKIMRSKGGSIEAWLNDSEFILSSDGSLFKTNLKGDKELLVKGSTYSPFFIGCAASADGKKLLAFSDDTKANVGAAAKSVWLFDIEKKNLRQLTDTASALWLDNNNILFLKNNELLKMNINLAKRNFLYKGNVEAYTVSGRDILFSESTVDDIGLYESSSLKVISQ